MAKGVPRVVVFLDGGAAGRAAQAEFNAAAANLGLPWVARCHAPGDAAADLGTAGAVVAFNPAASSQVPANGPAVEYWSVPDGPQAAAEVARGVSGLIARLLGGRIVADSPPAPPAAPQPKKVHTVRVGRETAGRRGKGVTTVFDLPLTGDQMRDLAAALKQACGTGGTVKDGRIEIQGDHRDRVVAELEQRGYKVKRSGG
jgi:predicted translation initiation factor SUI1